MCSHCNKWRVRSVSPLTSYPAPLQMDGCCEHPPGCGLALPPPAPPGHPGATGSFWSPAGLQGAATAIRSEVQQNRWNSMCLWPVRSQDSSAPSHPSPLLLLPQTAGSTHYSCLSQPTSAWVFSKPQTPLGLCAGLPYLSLSLSPLWAGLWPKIAV